MAFNLITKIFGSKHDKDIKKLTPLVDEINEIYESLHDKPDEWFTSRTEELKAILVPPGEEFLAHLEENPDLEKERKKTAYQDILGDKLDEILPEADSIKKEIIDCNGGIANGLVCCCLCSPCICAEIIDNTPIVREICEFLLEIDEMLQLKKKERGD